MIDATELLDAEAIEAGRVLFAQPCRFVLGAVAPADIPQTMLPEIAFAGRSNVGKSSLINALVGQNNLARTSNTPGRTQQINFFDLGGRLMMADLPGYGYARASKARVQDWTRLIDVYLKGRAPLRRVCLLIDARHGPKDSDRGVMQMLDGAAVSYQIVLTKADKASRTHLEKLRADIAAAAGRHTALHPDVVETSARKATGIPELRARLAALALPAAA